MIENFLVCDDYDTWVLKLSGGADSALILYYLQKIKKGQEFWILTGCNKYDEIYSDHARDVIRYLNVNNIYHILYPHDHKTGTEKNQGDYRFYMKFIKNIDLEKTLFIQGRTKNPSIDFKTHTRPIVRDLDKPEPIFKKEFFGKYTGNVLRPWVNTDKKEIVRLYKKENLMDLFNITRSCVSLKSNVCGKCFWCMERNWAVNEINDK